MSEVTPTAKKFLLEAMEKAFSVGVLIRMSSPESVKRISKALLKQYLNEKKGDSLIIMTEEDTLRLFEAGMNHGITTSDKLLDLHSDEVPEPMKDVFKKSLQAICYD